MKELFGLQTLWCWLFGGHLWQLRERIGDWGAIIWCEACHYRKIIKK